MRLSQTERRRASRCTCRLRCQLDFNGAPLKGPFSACINQASFGLQRRGKETRHPRVTEVRLTFSFSIIVRALEKM